MRGGRTKKGLQVGHSHGLVKAKGGSRCYRHSYEPQCDGWYIYVWMQVNGKGGYRALLGLRFARQQDALRGMSSLTAAGLDCYSKLKDVLDSEVRQIACANLQW